MHQTLWKNVNCTVFGNHFLENLLPVFPLPPKINGLTQKKLFQFSRQFSGSTIFHNFPSTFRKQPSDCTQNYHLLMFAILGYCFLNHGCLKCIYLYNILKVHSFYLLQRTFITILLLIVWVRWIEIIPNAQKPLRNFYIPIQVVFIIFLKKV